MNAVPIETLIRRPIYHITDWRNLVSILQIGGLRCHQSIKSENLEVRSAAYEHINQRRQQTKVRVSEGGVLSDYVPFHFAPHSPMLCAIAHGQVPGVNQHDIVHLSIKIERLIEERCVYAFTDGHPISALTNFYDHIAQLHKIDWSVMDSVWWHNTPDDRDRTRRRGAEFLIHQFAPWELVRGIGVSNESVAEAVLKILSDSPKSSQIPVRILPRWYFI